MFFKAEAKIPDSLAKSEFINRLRIKNIYPAIFGDIVRINLVDAKIHQAKYVISSYSAVPNRDNKNTLKFQLQP